MIRKVVGYLMMIAATGVMIYTRFANPELTETQLIIEFWYVWLLSVVVMFAGVLVLPAKKASKEAPRAWPFKVD